MSINGVTSFRANNLETLMAEPPANPASVIASHSMEPDKYEKSESSAGKTVAKSLIGLGVVAATLGLLRGKVEMFQKIDLTKGMSGQDGFLAKTNYCVAKAGDFVNEYALKAWNWTKGLFGKGEKVANETQNK